MLTEIKMQLKNIFILASCQGSIFHVNLVKFNLMYYNN